MQKLAGNVKRRTPKPENGDKNIFCNLLYCADCGKKLWYHTNTNNSNIHYGSRTMADAIFQENFKALEGEKFQLVNVLSHETQEDCEHGFIYGYIHSCCVFSLSDLTIEVAPVAK